MIVTTLVVVNGHYARPLPNTTVQVRILLSLPTMFLHQLREISIPIFTYLLIPNPYVLLYTCATERLIWRPQQINKL